MSARSDPYPMQGSSTNICMVGDATNARGAEEPLSICQNSRDEWGKEWELLIQLFADDAHHCASGSNCVKGLEERFEIATLWFAFFGVEHRATKCTAVVGRWSEAECQWAEDKRWTDGGLKKVVRVKDLHDGTEEEVPKVATGADQRALRVQVNMEGYWS